MFALLYQGEWRVGSGLDMFGKKAAQADSIVVIAGLGVVIAMQMCTDLANCRGSWLSLSTTSLSGTANSVSHLPHYPSSKQC